MAQQSFLDKVREWIGGVAWAIFLWSARMTEDEYFAEQDRAAELQRAPVHAEQKCRDCGGTGYLVDMEGNEHECLLCQ